MPGRQRTFCGFALIELMVVLAIMGILLALAGPRVAKSLGGLTLKTAARKVAGSMRFARSRAVNSGDVHTVIFDLEKNAVHVVRHSRPASDQAPALDNATAEDDFEDVSIEDMAAMIPQREIKTLELPGGTLIRKVSVGSASQADAEGDDIFQTAFFPNGTTQGAEIVIADEKERAYAITVDYITGVVSIDERMEE